jgi:hypothetical protein
MSKIGLHILPGPRTGYGDFLRRLAAAGTRPAVVKVVGEFGAAREAKEICGDATLTVGRLAGYGWEGFDQAAETIPIEDIDQVAERVWADHYEHIVIGNPWIDVWETSNEWSAHWLWQAALYVALAPRFESYHVKLGLFACSTGNPPDDAYPAIAMCLKDLGARGHYLTLHEYGISGDGMLKGSQPNHALRYRRLYDYLFDHNALAECIITEAGQHGGSTFPGVEAFIADCGWYDAELQRDPYIVGAAMWTLGGLREWAGANIQAAVPTLADYLIAHKDDEPTPPPPPPPVESVPYVVKVNLLPQDATLAEKIHVVSETHAFRETILQSADDARRLVKPGRPGSKVKVWGAKRWTGGDIVAYLGTGVELLDFPTQPDEPPPPPPSPAPAPMAWVGLHMAARGGPFSTGDWECLSRGKIEAVKVLSNHSFEDVERLIALGYDPQKMVLRLFADMRDKEMNADKFYNVHRGWLTFWREKRCRYVEVHNEPNHFSEGLDLHWQSAGGFAAYYLGVARAIRRDYPELLIGYPGLWPSAGENDARTDVANWLLTISALAKQDLIDWLGAHSYWTTETQMDDPAHGRYYRRFRSFGVPVFITEFSNNSTLASHADKAAQYVRYYASLGRDGVSAAYCYVSSAAGGEFANEVWVTAQGAVTAIPDIVGARKF